jgi:hypothetical protein
MKTTAQTSAMQQVRKINRAIAAAMKAHEEAQRAYAQMRNVCKETEEAENAAESAEQLADHWKMESEAWQSSDEAAKAAMAAGKNVAQYADHLCYGTAAMKAAKLAFESAMEWMA